MIAKKQLPFKIVFGIPLTLLLISVLLATKIYSVEQSYVFSNAIIADLLITIPCVYFVLIRKTNIPKITIVPFFVIGLLLASMFIPEKNQQYLELVMTYVLPIVELGVFLFIVTRLYKLVNVFSSNKRVISDFYDNLKQSASSILPNKISNMFATEISVLYYGFVYWRTKRLSKNEFSYHKNSGAVGLFFGLLLVIAIEMSVVDVLLARWNEMAAWVLTGLSVYSSVQIFGFLKSIMKRPIEIKQATLHLKYGILSETIIRIENIKSIKKSTKTIEKEDGVQYLSLLNELDAYNVIIELNEGNTVHGLYGLKKKYKALAFYVDNPSDFMTKLEKKRKALQYQVH